MKIIHIISNLGKGGAERLVIDLAETQLKMEHDVSIISFKSVDYSLYPDELENLNIKTFAKKKGVSISLIFSLYQYLRSESPDVINCHLPSVFLYVLFPIFFLTKIVFYYTIHSDPAQEEPRHFVRNLRKILIKRKRLIPIAISDKIRENFVNLYKVDEVISIPNGRNKLQKTKDFENVLKEVQEYKVNNETKVFISVGRISKEKNHQLLVKTFAELYKMNETVVLLLIGNDYGLGLLEDYLKIKTDNTYFLGAKNNVADYLYCSDVFCLSSIYEGFPISIIEALSVGLPIIATNVGGISDIIKDHENGFLVNSLEINDYLNAVTKYLSLEKQEIEKISKHNMSIFQEKYNIQITAKEYIAAYQKYALP